jgi:hypothetical protein
MPLINYAWTPNTAKSPTYCASGWLVLWYFINCLPNLQPMNSNCVVSLPFSILPRSRSLCRGFSPRAAAHSSTTFLSWKQPIIVILLNFGKMTLDLWRYLWRPWGETSTQKAAARKTIHFCAQAIFKVFFLKQPSCNRKCTFQNNFSRKDSSRAQTIPHDCIKFSQILRNLQFSEHFRNCAVFYTSCSMCIQWPQAQIAFPADYLK